MRKKKEKKIMKKKERKFGWLSNGVVGSGNMRWSLLGSGETLSFFNVGLSKYEYLKVFILSHFPYFFNLMPAHPTGVPRWVIMYLGQARCPMITL
jgi:hypothetical protein